MYFGGRKRRLCPSFRFKRCQAPSVLTRALALGSAGAKPHRTSLLPGSKRPQTRPAVLGRAWMRSTLPSRAVPGWFWQGKLQRRTPHRDGSRQLQAWHQQSLVSALDPRPSFSSLPVDFLPQGIPQERDGKKAGIDFLGCRGTQPKEKPKVDSPSPSASEVRFG